MSKSMKKKKNRKLRRQIRKTFGALLMISAIVVAALPVQDVSANPTENGTVAIKVAVVDSQQASDPTSPFYAATSKYTSKIPHACERDATPEEQIVYTSGDGTFQFVYMRPTTSDRNKVAVILGYDINRTLSGGTLTIPETLEAYNKYTDNATNQGYCLVSKNNEFLHYETQVQKTNGENRKLYTVPSYLDPLTHQNPEVAENQLVLVDGVQKYCVTTTETVEGEVVETDNYYDVEPIMVSKTDNPCYYEQIDQWRDIPDTDLYYRDSSTGDMVQAGNEDSHWKIIANVAYIGSEKIKDNGTTGWELDGDISDPEDGIFAGAKNIETLIVGENILGIGDYAFYKCTNLQSISLANGLNTIGNGAFAECINMSNCSLASTSMITAIGKDAFYNCRSLKSFSVPTGLEALGDSCFENCIGLETIDFSGGGSQVALRELGDHLFKGCSSLTAVEFPDAYYDINQSGTQQEIDIAMFEGCTSLQYVKAPNASLKFKDTGTLPWESEKDASGNITKLGFKDTVPESFYFEGLSVSQIHDTATTYSIAFKYLGQDLYEKIMYERDALKDAAAPVDQKSAKVTYQVNSLNELVKFTITKGDKPENVTIPEKIGPYGISAIGKGSFNDNCDLTRITIPASVTAIGDEAFKGCHNLETVIFTDATTMQSIGTDAFKTQVISCGETLKDDPELVFVGAMMNASGADTVPFMYAMNGVSNINNPDQEKIWITCHSGWPTNLEVQYKYDPITNTGQAQLVGYPRYSMIDNTTAAEAWVETLPYVTDENVDEYKNMVNKATAYYKASDIDKQNMQQPTENEMAIITSTLNVVVPTSVDCIEPGLFSGYTYDADGNPEVEGTNGPDTDIQTIVLNGVDEVDPYTFSGCTSLREAAIIGPTYLGDYAFGDNSVKDSSGNSALGCTALETVTLGTNLADTGKRPFAGCTKLNNINCLDSDFSFSNGILYRHTTNGTEIVECLEGRGNLLGSYSVGPDELTGVTTIKEEAFMDCDEIGKVDLSTTTITVVPEKCFEDTDDLNSVILPDTVKNIEADAFKDSNIRLLTIPGTQAYIAQDAFKSDPQQTIIFECIEDLTADRYAQEYPYITPEYGKVNLTHTVYFWDYPNYPDKTEKTLFDKQTVVDGEDAAAPSASPFHAGYTFSGWTDYTNISRDTDVYPEFGSEIYMVEFRDYDGTLIGDVQYIEEGKSATPPADPTRDGYTFTGWNPDYHDIKDNTTIIAQYDDNSGNSNRHTVTFYAYDGTTVVSEQKVDDGGDAVAPMPPTRSGYTFVAWVPSTFTNVTKDLSIVASYEPSGSANSSANPSASGSANSSASPSSSASASASASSSASPSASPEVKTYTVSVSGGSGSGSYPAGQVVAINAYDMGEGQNFDRWTTSTAGVGFANASATSTTFTMPAANVAITATYKTGSGTAASNTTGTGSTGGSGTTAGNNNSGTTVDVDRPGISNTNLAGATVSGSTDNFVVKITETQEATDAVISALQAKFGDISRIKYLAMDISLYDSTGRTKIADTSGLSVNITLPLPDDLIQYAGNNKIAGVVNGAVQDLNARFTTVDGVPCINFTATHFSPYTIYVDTSNLTEATIDATPKTGDPIHPKWFLAIGLACISLILFFKRDKAVVHKIA